MLDPKSKKRKLSEPPRALPPPLKKVATGSARPIGVKKEPVATSKATAPAVKDAKSDSSFFSAPKPKPKLPSFKKAPPAPAAGVSGKKEDGTNVAQPSAIDPFQEALKSMKTRKGSPLATVVSTPSPHGSNTGSAGPEAGPSSAAPGYTRLGKRKKTVTWAPDGKLESIRLIERAIYGDENSDVSAVCFVSYRTFVDIFFFFPFWVQGGVYSTHSLRDLDRSEGAALHMHLFEETVDWSEPLRE